MFIVSLVVKNQYFPMNQFSQSQRAIMILYEHANCC